MVGNFRGRKAQRARAEFETIMCSGCFGENEFDDEFGADQDEEAMSFFDTEERADLGT